jgi:hypothetical protein
MADVQGDYAVEEYAKANNNRIVMLDKSGVFLNRNDCKRQNPIRNPLKNSHDEGIPFMPERPVYSDYDQNTNGLPLSGAYGYSGPVIAPYQNSHNEYQPLSESHGGPPPPAPYSAQYAPQPLACKGHPQNLPPPNPNFRTLGSSTQVLLENLPLSAAADDIAACLGRYSLNVLQCSLEYDQDPKASWCYAYAELATLEESSRCLALAKQSLLEYRGRILSASFDPHFNFPIYPPPQAPPVTANQTPPSHYAPPPPPYHKGPRGPLPQQPQPPQNSSSPTYRNSNRGFRRSGGRGGGRGSASSNRNRGKHRDRPY